MGQGRNLIMSIFLAIGPMFATPSAAADCLSDPNVDCAIGSALEAARSIEDNGQRAQALTLVARAMADMDRPVEARSHIENALFLVDGQSKSDRRDVVLVGIVRVLAMLGDTPRAKRLSQEIGDPLESALAQMWLAYGEAIHGHADSSARHLYSARAKAAGLSRLPPPLFTAYIALAAAAAGNAENGRKLAMDAIDSTKGMPPARSVPILAVGAVARHLAGDRSGAQVTLMEAIAVSGLAHSDGTPPAGISSMLSFLVWGQAEAGFHESARIMLGQLTEAMADVDDPLHRVAAFSTIALVLHRIGDAPARP